MKILFLLNILLVSLHSYSQVNITGTVIDIENELSGVLITELGTNNSTYSLEGKFELTLTTKTPKISFELDGYTTDTLEVGNDTTVFIILNKSKTVDIENGTKYFGYICLERKSYELNSLSAHLTYSNKFISSYSAGYTTDFNANNEYFASFGLEFKKKIDSLKTIRIPIIAIYENNKMPVFNIQQEEIKIAAFVNIKKLQKTYLYHSIFLGISSKENEIVVGGQFNIWFNFNVLKDYCTIDLNLEKWDNINSAKIRFTNPIFNTDFRSEFAYERYNSFNIYSVGLLYSFAKYN